MPYGHATPSFVKVNTGKMFGNEIYDGKTSNTFRKTLDAFS